MERVLILGCGGAGKSTLARALGERTGLPLIHLDQGWWRSGWTNPTEEEFDCWLEEQLAGERWILDGNYARTLKKRLSRADTAVFLDYSTWTCLWGMLKRVFRYLGRTRPDMTEGCPERFDRAFIRWIRDYRREARPRVLELLSSWDGEVIVFRNRRACARWLNTI